MSDTTPATAKHKPRGAVRRWSRRLGIGLLVVLLLVVGAGLFAVYTATGTRWVLQAALSLYDDAIPGHATVATIDGSLADGVTLGGVRLSDRFDRPLVEADRLQLRLGLDGTGAIVLDAPRVYAVRYDEGGFGDLAPEGPPEAKAEEVPPPPFGPELPLALDLDLRLHGGLVLTGDPEAPVVTLAAHDVAVSAAGEGRHAHARLEGWLSSPATDVDVYWLDLEVDWADPVAEVESLWVESNLGTIELAQGRVDLAAERFAVAQLRAAVEGRWLADVTGLPTAEDAELAVAVEVEGSAEDFSADVLARQPDGADLAATVFGSLAPRLHLQLLLDASVEDVAALGLPPLQVDGTASAVAGEGGTVASVDLACQGCIALGELGPLRLRADAFAGEEGTWGAGRVGLTAATASIEMDAGVNPDGAAGLRARVDVPDLATFTPLLARFAPGLDVAGAVEADLACAAVVEPRAGVCRVQIGVEDGRPIERARLDAAATMRGADGVAVRLRELLVAAPAPQGAGDVLVQQRAGEAEIVYTPRGVAVRDLSLKVATRTGAGSIELGGEVSLDADRTAEVRARVRQLDLAAANAFVPSLRAAGTVDASLDASGSLSAPRLLARVSGRGLAALGVQLGDLDASAGYAGSEVSLDLRAQGDLLGTIEARARAPVRLDLGAGGLEVLSGQPARATVGVQRFPLTTVGRFAAAAGPLSGTVDLELTLARSLGRPALTLTTEIRDGRWDGKRLPDVDVEAHYERGSVTVQVDATHETAFDRFALAAEVPLRLDLSRGDVRWRADDPHRVDLDLEGARLAEAKTWNARADLGGRVDLHADVTGTMRAPVLDATLAGSDLRYQDRELGKTSFALTYADRQARLELFAAGPWLGGIGVVGEVPITVVPATGAVTWHRDEPHRLRASVNEVVIEKALAWARLAAPPGEGLDLPVRGRLYAELEATGPATDPSITLHTTVEDGAYRGRDLGELALDAGYGDKRATAELTWARSALHTARARADVPVTLDLPGGRADWRRTEEHRLRIALPRVDRALLEPFVDIGGLDVATSVYVVANGSVEAFQVDAAVRGSLRANEDVHRLSLDASVTEAQQTFDFDIGWGTIAAKTDASIPALIEGADWRAVPLQVRAEVNGAPLATLAGFIPEEVRDLEGRFTVNAAVDGTLGKPVLDGAIRVHDGGATVVPARARIEKLELSARLDNDHLAVERLDFATGAGHVEGRGRIDVVEGEGLHGDVHLDIDHVPVRSPGLPRMTVTSKVQTELAIGLSTVEVGVRISDAKVDVQTARITAAKPIPDNGNVRYVDFDDPAARAPPPPPSEAPAPSRTTRLRIELADPLRIVGPAVDMSWAGAVRSEAGPAGATTSGDLHAQKGYFDLLGNKFDLARGTVTLPDDGSGLPFVDVVAHTEVDDARITATVRGQLPKPELILSSSPAMTQSEIFTVLVTGSTDTSNADAEEVEAKAASVLAAVSNPALQRTLNERLHVDRIGVGFGETTEQPILTVGKNVTKRVYAETQYHHNAPKNDNRAEVRVEYRFAPRWSLETFFGDAAEGGIDLFWGRAFDTDRNRRKSASARE